MTKVPITLILLRLAIGPLIILLSEFHISNYSLIAILLLTIGLLSDIFDGIVARKYNVSTPTLRRLDSSIDQVFYLSVIYATFVQCPDFFYTNIFKLSALLGLELFTYLVCFIKFKKEIATHTIGAKFWALILYATLIQIILQCQSVLLFDICFYIGVITRIEIFSILLSLKSWQSDVPTFYHALQLRKGREIKRNKLFNG